MRDDDALRKAFSSAFYTLIHGALLLFPGDYHYHEIYHEIYYDDENATAQVAS